MWGKTQWWGIWVCFCFTYPRMGAGEIHNPETQQTKPSQEKKGRGGEERAVEWRGGKKQAVMTWFHLAWEPSSYHPTTPLSVTSGQVKNLDVCLHLDAMSRCFTPSPGVGLVNSMWGSLDYHPFPVVVSTQHPPSRCRRRSQGQQ